MTALQLRDYQREAVDAVHAAYARGVTRQLVALPTGAGKTFVSAHLVAEVGMPTVFMVHREELVTQTQAQMRMVNPHLSTGVVKAERNELYADIIIISAQTIAHPARLDRVKRALSGDVLFISDECHHDRAVSRQRAIEVINPALLVGLTATPKRGDKLGLDAIYEEIVYHLPMRTLVEKRHLARPVGLRIESEEDLDSVRTVAGEFVESDLADTIDTAARNRLIVQSWLTHAADRSRTVVFAVSVAHAQRIRDAFREAGVSAEMVDGSTPTEERRRIFAAFHDGDIRVLTNCMVLTEGFDEPGIDCAIMARPTKSQALYVQCVGRALRWKADKPDALIIDVVDVTSRHQLVTLPSLSGSEPMGERERPLTEGDRKPGQVMDLFDAMGHHGRLREREAIMLDLLADSPLVWQPLPDGAWFSRAAATGGGGWVAVIPEGDGYMPVRVWSHPHDVGMERLVDRAVGADTAMSIAQELTPFGVLNTTGARWRDKPATPTQIAAAGKWRIPLRDGVTRGEVSDLIEVAAFRATMRKLGLSGRKAG